MIVKIHYLTKMFVEKYESFFGDDFWCFSQTFPPVPYAIDDGVKYKCLMLTSCPFIIDQEGWVGGGGKFAFFK